MKIIYSPNQELHNPKFEVFNGEQTPHQEIPERAINILNAIKDEGLQVDATQENIPDELLKCVHDTSYIQFLIDKTNALTEEEYSYPSVFPYVTYSEKNIIHPVVKQGMYSFDMYTPLLKHTYDIARQSASAAYEIAKGVEKGIYKVGYALCRPPGHHAEHAKMGGYCYFNNCAVAAEYLSKFGKVSTLDVDFHHGNGTQNIFYKRADIYTVSIHADPNWKFPFYTGFEDENGVEQGEGKNLNIALHQKTTNDQYQLVLEQALEKIKAFNPGYLVVSLGVDTHESDPIGGFSLTTEYYTKMAKTISKLNLPTVIVQEGGYNTEKLGENVTTFLKGFI